MMTKIFSKVLPLIAVLTCFTMGAAKADVYTFIQTGFDDGGTITGSFTGNDLDGDGQIVSIQGFVNEVTALTASYNGGNNIPSLTFDLSSLIGLVYNVGTPFLGDDIGGYAEGLAFFDFSGNLYFSGVGPNSVPGGLLNYQDINGLLSSSSNSPIEILSTLPENPSNVPLPSSLLLAVLGMVYLRKRSNLS